MLEVGAGPTNPTSAFLATLGTVHGLDVSDEALDNVHLTESRVVTATSQFPYDDGSFDAAVSNYAVEHVSDPRKHLSEIRRVLKPGSPYLFRTPNLFHYVAMVSRFTPHQVHLWLANPLRAMGRAHHDPWPTVYAMNTPVAVRRLAADTGFDVETMKLVEKEPSYGLYARPLFLLLMAYERAVNATEFLAALRANLFVVLRRS